MIIITRNGKIKEFRIVATAVLNLVKIQNPFTGKMEKIGDDNKIVKVNLPRIDELERKFVDCEEKADKKMKLEYKNLLKSIQLNKHLTNKEIKTLLFDRCSYKFNTGFFIGLNNKGVKLFVKTFRKSGLSGLDTLIIDFKNNFLNYEEYLC